MIPHITKHTSFKIGIKILTLSLNSSTDRDITVNHNSSRFEGKSDIKSWLDDSDTADSALYSRPSGSMLPWSLKQPRSGNIGIPSSKAPWKFWEVPWIASGTFPLWAIDKWVKSGSSYPGKLVESPNDKAVAMFWAFVIFVFSTCNGFPCFALGFSWASFGYLFDLKYINKNHRTIIIN